MRHMGRGSTTRVTWEGGGAVPHESHGKGVGVHHMEGGAGQYHVGRGRGSTSVLQCRPVRQREDQDILELLYLLLQPPNVHQQRPLGLEIKQKLCEGWEEWPITTQGGGATVIRL